MGIAVSIIVAIVLVLFFIGLGPAKTTATVVHKGERAIKATPSVIHKGTEITASTATKGVAVAKTGGAIAKVVAIGTKDATKVGLANFRAHYKEERENLKQSS